MQKKTSISTENVEVHGLAGGVPIGLGKVREAAVGAERIVSLRIIQQKSAIPDIVFCRFWYKYLVIQCLQSTRQQNLLDNERLDEGMCLLLCYGFLLILK
jgi:hypothetical protein